MTNLIRLLVTAILVFALVACSARTVDPATAVDTLQNVTTASTEATATAAPSATASSAAQAAAENSPTHAAATDDVWDSSAEIPITLNGDSIAVDTNAVTVDGGPATITAAGTYNLSGTLSDGQIVVNTEDDGVVRLILNGVDLGSSASAPIYIVNAEKAVIVLADGMQNSVFDAATPVFGSADEDEPNAAIFSAADLTITGNGSLTVNGTYNDGIASKDGLIINSGTIAVSAVDDGIRGKDYLVINMAM